MPDAEKKIQEILPLREYNLRMLFVISNTEIL